MNDKIAGGKHAWVDRWMARGRESEREREVDVWSERSVAASWQDCVGGRREWQQGEAAFFSPGRVEEVDWRAAKGRRWAKGTHSLSDSINDKTLDNTCRSALDTTLHHIFTSHLYLLELTLS